jgi:dynein heavy chain
VCVFASKREPLPDEWMTKLDSFQRIIVLKCLRPDKVTNAMQDFVAENIGQRFIEPQVQLKSLIYLTIQQ